ncbi:hypothetical protein MNB_SM-4-886 [hydrothermal vent metagenome]|uniref:Uncharacterized protein n=1 Tax=hydrothermal vent metagenome TaxID=652676 RepID=A0A1W1BSG8_9ZZZZ
MLNGVIDYRLELENSEIYTFSGNRTAMNKHGEILFFLQDTISKLDPISGKITVQNKYVKEDNKRRGYTGELIIDKNDVYFIYYQVLYKASDI